jgi:hypothetical protein
VNCFHVFLPFIYQRGPRAAPLREISFSIFLLVDVGVDVEAMNNGAVVLLIGFTPVESQRSGPRAVPEK